MPFKVFGVYWTPIREKAEKKGDGDLFSCVGHRMIETSKTSFYSECFLNNERLVQ